MGMAVGMRAWSAERCVNAASSSFRLSDCCASLTWMSSSCRPSSSAEAAVGGVWSVNSSSMTPEASGCRHARLRRGKLLGQLGIGIGHARHLGHALAQSVDADQLGLERSDLRRQQIHVAAQEIGIAPGVLGQRPAHERTAGMSEVKYRWMAAPKMAAVTSAPPRNKARCAPPRVNARPARRGRA